MTIRYRESKRFGRPSLLVLQIAYTVDHTGNDDVQPSMQRKCTYFRDATVEDLQLIESDTDDQAQSS